MVRIQQAQRRVGQRGLPGPRAPGPAPAEAFGAGLGRLAEDIILQERAKADRTAAQNAVTGATEDLHSLLYDPETGLAHLRGEALFEAAGRAPADAQSVLERRAAALNPRQRDLVNERFAAMRARFVGDVQRIEGPERQRFHREAYERAVETTLNTSYVRAAAPGAQQEVDGTLQTPVLDEALTQLAVINMRFAADHGETLTEPAAEWQERVTEEKRSRLISLTIGQLIEGGDSEGARALLAKYGDRMRPVERARATASVARSSDLGAIVSTYEVLAEERPLVVGGAAERAYRDAGREWISPRAQIEARVTTVREEGRRRKWSAEKIEEAVSYTRSRAQRELEAIEAARSARFEMMQAALVDMGGDILRLEQAHPVAFADLGSEEMASLRALVSDFDEAAAHDRFRALMAQAHSRDTGVREAFTDRDLNIDAPHLSDVQIKELRKVQADLRERRFALLDGTRSKLAQIDDAIAGLELDKDEADAFASMVDEVVRQESAIKGRQLTGQEHQEIVNRLQREAFVVTRGGQVMTLDDPLFQTTADEIDLEDIPVVAANQIRAALLENGITPDDETVKASFLLALSRGTVFSEPVEAGVEEPTDRQAAIDELAREFRAVFGEGGRPALRR